MYSLVVADNSVDYSTKEGPVVVAALVWVLALGGAAAVSIMLCGWRGTKKLAIDWIRGKAIFYCR